MRLFQMKAEVHGRNRIEDFLEHNYVCLGPAGIGDLERLSETDLMRRLAAIERNEQLAELYKEMHLFVLEMRDGDYILLQDNGTVYLGDLGDYYYVESYDSEEEASSHRRGVTWLTAVPEAGISNELRSLLETSDSVSMLEKQITRAELERTLLAGDAPNIGSNDANVKVEADFSDACLVPKAMILEALSILQEAMRSNDAERRERAAIAVLGYVSGRGNMPIS
ncbi:hypothetical protein [Paenibacillus sp. HB172176]|uniref:hypothetical protein n=1 Tax=Paenibacillus sp. HB172176 TaxID=2493690 RepID=UPI0014398354|nr:hypothetical protein [Paenibacillus sp. HB172176]